MNLFNLFRTLFGFLFLSIVDGDGGAEPTPTPTPSLRLSAEEQIAARVNDAQAADFHGFDETTGEIDAAPIAAAPPAPAEPEVGDADPEPGAAPEPAAQRMVAIVVDGQTIEVEESRILEAGKRTLQKDHAADRRLQEAANTKRQAEELLRQAQQLSIPDAARQAAPSQDAPQQPQPQPATSFTPEMLETVLENKLYMRDATKAAAKFREDFPDIAADPHLMSMAANMEQQRLNTATALGESYGDPFEAYRKHGEAVQKWVQKFTGAAPAPATQDKADRKRTITAIPAANARAPAPQPPKELTVSQIIEEERKSRGRPMAIKH